MSLSLPTLAQDAPAGWTTQTKTGGARTFTPPDLKAGEVYSVTIYDAAPLGGKSLGDFLRAFAGTVGTKPGQLVAPVKINATRAQAVTGIGVYNAPNGKALSVMFVGFSFDGKNISLARTLLSNEDVFGRYKENGEALMRAMARRDTSHAKPVESPARVTTQEEDAKRKQDAAIQDIRDRFKWVTKPGGGVKSSQIAAILNWMNYTPTIAPYSESTSYDNYLLLRDGTIYRGLPVPPDEFDAAKSRVEEPENWGRWKRNGEDYQASWNGKPFEDVLAVPVVPASAGQKLAGYYGDSSGYSDLSSSSFNAWGITFAPNGRFRIGFSSVSSASFGGPASGSPGMVQRSEDGSFSSSVTSADVIASASSPNKTPLTDRQGAYSLSGYTLTLRFDNGRVVRSPFFQNKKRDQLWYDGAMLKLNATK